MYPLQLYITLCYTCYKHTIELVYLSSWAFLLPPTGMCYGGQPCNATDSCQNGVCRYLLYPLPFHAPLTLAFVVLFSSWAFLPPTGMCYGGQPCNATDPCQNGATCCEAEFPDFMNNGSLTTHRYCICNQGYVGQNCEHEGEMQLCHQVAIGQDLGLPCHMMVSKIKNGPKGKLRIG